MNTNPDIQNKYFFNKYIGFILLMAGVVYIFYIKPLRKTRV